MVDLTVTITDHDGTSGLEVATQRTFTVGQWNQPMDDHEVLLHFVGTESKLFDGSG